MEKAGQDCVELNSEPVETIMRFHSALRELTGRRGIRNDVSRYESIALVMVESAGEGAGEVFSGFPPDASPLRLDSFFQTLYLRYEERFLFGAPDLKSVTKRLEWSTTSPALNMEPQGTLYPRLDYPVRQAVSE